MHYIAPGQYRERYEGYYYNLWYVWHNAGGRVVRGWRYQIEGSIESSLFETRTMAAKETSNNADVGYGLAAAAQS